MTPAGGRATAARSSAGAGPWRRVPFDVVDESVNLLETDAEPWSIQLEARTPTRIDECKLRGAVGEALMRHPMARARRVAAKRGSEHRYHWEITAAPELDPLQVIDCSDDEALAAARCRLQGLPVPLAESPPLRLHLVRAPTGDVVMVNVNHAASDGIGALRFLQSVARSYAGRPDPPPDIDVLEARNLTAVVGRGGMGMHARRAALLAGKLGDLVVPPARLASDASRDEPGYGFRLLSLSESETAAVTGGGQPRSANDVLVAALHLTIAAWNRDHGRPGRRIGVMVPLDMRPAAWRGEVMGNLLLPVRVTTHPGERSSPASTLQAVVRQTRRLKQRAIGAALIEPLRGFHRLPVWAKEAASPLLRLAGGRLADTALLSNLGRIDDPPRFDGEAGGGGLWFSPPARMPLGVSLGALTVGGRLHLAMRYRHPVLGPEAAARFTDRYLLMLERCASACPPEVGVPAPR